MGQLTITPSYVDLSNGAAWSSLGSNTALAQAAIGQVCTDIKNGTRTIGADIGVIVQVGLNAVPANAADTTGTAVPSGGSSVQYSTVTTAYSAFLTFLSGVTSPNSIQTSAWAGLPGSPYNDGSHTWSFIGLCSTNIGLYDPSNPGFTNGQTVAGVGLHMTGATNFDQHGLGSGSSAYELSFHEITEGILKRTCAGSTTTVVSPWNYFAFSSLNTRVIDSTVTRFLSQDNGTTNIASMNTSIGNDAGDFDALANDAFNATGPNGPVSRDASTPLQVRDWQALSLYIPLSSTGNVWAGLAAAPTSVGLMSLRR